MLDAAVGDAEAADAAGVERHFTGRFKDGAAEADLETDYRSLVFDFLVQEIKGTIPTFSAVPLAAKLIRYWRRTRRGEAGF